MRRAFGTGEATMVCHACGWRLPWGPTHFPSWLGSKCWDCIDADAREATVVSITVLFALIMFALVAFSVFVLALFGAL